MRARACLVLMTIVGFGIGRPVRASGPLPVISVAIQDYSGVPTEVLTEAEGEASRIFRHAGVQVAWVDALVSPTTVRVNILSREMGLRTQARAGVLGLASVHSGMVYVLYDRVVDKSASLNVRVSRVLAFVMAHEIGHVLLAGRGHGHVGLMKPRLEPEVFRTGLVGFTADESREMRVGVGVR